MSNVNESEKFLPKSTYSSKKDEHFHRRKENRAELLRDISSPI